MEWIETDVKKTVVAYFAWSDWGNHRNSPARVPANILTGHLRMKVRKFSTRPNLFDLKVPFDQRQVGFIRGPSYFAGLLAVLTPCVKFISNRLSGYMPTDNLPIMRSRTIYLTCLRRSMSFYMYRSLIKLNMCRGLPERMPVSTVFWN